jgi:myo-inositol 2-dehydrogenase/D-chiro-inositol 1-dehydrogenase
MSRPLKLGIVGCGRLAELGYLPALGGLAEIELTAVADPDPERRELVAERGGAAGAVPAFATGRELVAAGAAEAIVIASPPEAHVVDATAAASAGLPCLVEKPPAVDRAGAEAIAGLSPRPWVGFNRRFQHGACLLGSIPAQGRLDLELEIGYRRESWRALAVRDDALLDLGTHLIDLALLLGGAEGAAVRSAVLEPERAELELVTARGSARVRCATDRPYRELVVARAGGRRVATSAAGGPARALLTRLPGVAHPLVASLEAQLAAFASVARRGDAGLLASAADGERAMRLVDEARAVSP